MYIKKNIQNLEYSLQGCMPSEDLSFQHISQEGKKTFFSGWLRPFFVITNDLNQQVYAHSWPLKIFEGEGSF